jgi:hypothetical protein
VWANLAAQSRDITSDEFNKEVNRTANIAQKGPVRVTLDHKTVLLGSLTREVIQIVEYAGPDKMRRRETFKVPGHPSLTRELIEIGSSEYCRLNSGPWKSSTDDCNPMFLPLMAPTDSITDKFTVTDTMLDGRPAKLFEHFQTFKRELVHKFDVKVWIDDPGNRLRAETLSGLVDDTDNYESEVETLEYNPKDLAIVAPRTGPRK